MNASAPTVPVVVVGGYLGAGKTTLINELLHNTQQRIAVIVNDFGSINIDASLISSRNNDTIELSNGCVCCALGDSLASTMLTIGDRDVQPDVVVIEASGVAHPAAIAANAYIGGFHLAGIVVLVDAVNAQRTASNPLVASTFHIQINSAHLLVITKSEEATADQLSACTELLQMASAPVIDRSRISLQDLISTHQSSPHANESVDASHSFRTELVTDVHFSHLIDLQAFCNAFPPSVVRAKGIVMVDDTHYLVQRVGTFTALSPTTLAPTGIVVIHAD
jgi:G3E family GTPase